jgi:hypothetical protein
MSDVGVDADLHGLVPANRNPEPRSSTIQASGGAAANPPVLARMIGLH